MRNRTNTGRWSMDPAYGDMAAGRMEERRSRSQRARQRRQ